MTYHQAGLAIASGTGHPNLVFWQPPGYPYFLGLLYWLAGPNLLLPRLAQVLLGAGSSVLVGAIGTRAFGRPVGLMAGLAAVLYGPLIYFDGELLTPSLGLFLQLLAMLAGLHAVETRYRAHWLLVGLLAGVATLVNATLFVMIPVFAAFARRRALLVVLGALIAISPATIRNFVRGGELVLVSSNAGVNFFIGNNPEYERLVAARPGSEWDRLIQEPIRAGIVGRNAQNAYFVRQVMTFARENPIDFTALQFRKLRLLLAGNEIPRNREIYVSRAESPVLWALLWKVPGLAFPFGLVVPLAAVGLVTGARRAPLLATLLVALAATVLLFFVTARYRVPLIPLLLVFAGEGIRWCVADATAHRRLAAVAAALVLYGISNVGQGPMETRMNADAEQAVAAQLIDEGRLDEARRLLDSALRQRPDYAYAWISAGVMHARLGQRDAAIAAMQEALRLEPGHPLARHNLELLMRWPPAGNPPPR